MSAASTSTSGSNRRVPPPRGSSSLAPLGPFFRPPLAVRLSSLRGVSSCRGGAACGSGVGSAFPSSLSISSLSTSAIRGEFVFRGRRMCFHVCVRFRLCPSFLVRLLFCVRVLPGLCLPGWPDVFPGRVHVPLEGLAVQGQQVHFVRGNGSHLSFNFVYSRGGSSGFECRLSFLGLWASAGQSMGLTIINTLIEPHLPICMLHLVQEKGEGQAHG